MAMRMKCVVVTWEKIVDAVVYVPEDMPDTEVEAVARETTRRIDRDGWDVGWDTIVRTSEILDVPDAECAVSATPGGRWLRPVEGSRFRNNTAMVVDDERGALVHAEDAAWWLAPTAQINDVEDP